MTFTMDLAPELEARLKAQAQAHGKPLEDYLRNAIEEMAAQSPGSITLEEWDRLADELIGEIDPTVPPLSDYAVSRESFYEGRP